MKTYDAFYSTSALCGQVFTPKGWVTPGMTSRLPSGSALFLASLLALLITLIICRRAIWK